MRQDLQLAFRQLIRQPGLAAAAILTLGLGLGASLAVFTLANALMLRPLPYPQPEGLMTIGRAGTGGLGASSHRDVRFLREHVRTCAPIAAAVGGSGLNVSLQGRVSHLQDRLVSRGYFEALGVSPSWGRAFSNDEDANVPPRVVIINERFAGREHLDPAALVGQDILLGGHAHTIVGVMGVRHTLPSDPDIFRPLGSDSRGGGQNLSVMCRLVEGATPAALDTELQALTEEARTEKLIGDRTPRAYAAVAQHEWEFGFVRPALVTLMAAVGLVLLVAAANTTGLLLVRAAGRRREIAMRAALGAAPRRLARALVTEGLLLAAIAGMLGLAATPLLLRGLLSVAPAYYVDLADYTIDGVVILCTIGLCALVGLVVSLPPLMEVRRLNLRDTLQEEGTRGTSGRRAIWLRQLLVGAETAVCAVLLVGALLLTRTFINLVNVPTGFDPTDIVTARMTVQGAQYEDSARLIRFFEDGIARLEESPSIEGAAVAASLPAERALNLPARFPDSANPQAIQAVNWRYVTPRYFELLRIRHVAGRLIAETDRAGAPAVALVNETFAKQIYGGIPQALGRQIAVNRDAVREIVGVVADTSGWSLADPPRPLMFVPLPQVEAAVLRTAHSFFPPRWIVRTSENVEGARRQLESVVRELDPSQPFVDVQTLESLMLGSIGMQRFYFVVLMTFAVFAVVLAAVGVYASYSYAVASRTQEIGVRLALGAAPGRILRRVVGQGLLLGGIAIAVGLAGAAAASRVLQAVLFGVSPTDPLTYAAVGVTLLATVLAATLVPALRAARVDPLVAIRR